VLDARSVRFGLLTAVAAVLVWQLFPFALVVIWPVVAALARTVTHGPVELFDAEWTFSGFSLNTRQAAEVFAVAAVGFGGGVWWARRRRGQAG
jgi:hypothetical protein